MSSAAELTHHYATTANGAKLSYYSIGAGPGILIMHGAVSYGLTFTELAAALSPWYTVHAVSRRGRGLSAPFPPSVTGLEPQIPTSSSPLEPEHSITIANKSYPCTHSAEFNSAVLETEVSDLDTLLAATGATYILSLSAGALVTLHALLNPSLAPTLHRNVRKAIVFEPPVFFTDYATPHMADLTLLSQYEREALTGDEVGAMVTAMHLVQLGPTWIPRPIMRWMSGMMFRAEEKKAEREKAIEKKGNCTFRGLGAMLRYDFGVVIGMVLPIARYKTLGLGVDETVDNQTEQNSRGKIELLLLGGSKTPKFNSDGLVALEETIPGIKRIIIPGVGHEALCNKELRGNPKKAVPAIREFFK